MSLASYEWFNGAPKADNPRQARQQWAPHLNEWTGIVQHRFWWEAPVEPGQARIAWIARTPSIETFRQRSRGVLDHCSLQLRRIRP